MASQIPASKEPWFWGFETQYASTTAQKAGRKTSRSTDDLCQQTISEMPKAMKSIEGTIPLNQRPS